MAGTGLDLWRLLNLLMGGGGLLAQLPEGVSLLQTLVTLLSAGGLATIGLGIKWLIENRQKSKSAEQETERKARGDALVEWKEYAAKLEGDLAKREAVNEKLMTRVTRYSVMITALQGRIDVLETANEQLHIGADPFLINQFVNPVAQLGVDEAGIITDAEPKIRPILHYTVVELKGRNVRDLIPLEFREKHEVFMKRARDDSVMLDPRNVLPLLLLNREGDRVPVNLRILRWKEDGHWRFGVYVQERDVLPDSNGGSHSGDSGAFLKAGAPEASRPTTEMPMVAAVVPAKAGGTS